LKLSKRTEYGVRAIVQLARSQPGTYIQSKDLAQQERLPNKFLESILLALRRGGFLESKIGREGGYRLAREARAISVGDLIRRLEGRMSISQGKLADDIAPGEVAVYLLNQRLTRATEEVMDALTLDQLVDHVNKASMQHQEMYYI
jgi:Rrf2 family protein